MTSKATPPPTQTKRPRPSDDQPIAGLRALRQVDPPPSLVPAVMRAIAEPRPVSFWQWLLRPRRIELRITPAGLFAAAAIGAIALYALQTTPRRHAGTQIAQNAQIPTSPGPSGGAVANATDVVQVRFVLLAKGARRVAIAGDFNGWNAEGTVLENADGQGTFVATVPLPRGAHEYMFLVDGKWLTDPAAHETRPDGFGRSNAVLRL